MQTTSTLLSPFPGTIKEGYTEKNWSQNEKKHGCGNWCCLRCIQTWDSNLGTNYTCWPPKARGSGLHHRVRALWLWGCSGWGLRPWPLCAQDSGFCRLLPARAPQSLGQRFSQSGAPGWRWSVASMSKSVGVHQLGFLEIKLLKNIYLLCYYSCPISPPSLHSVLLTPSLPHPLPIAHVHGSYI